ncbi:MAG: hypothetical protein MHM6MM_002987 [Cercozoa sp. M6MM]
MKHAPDWRILHHDYPVPGGTIDQSAGVLRNPIMRSCLSVPKSALQLRRCEGTPWHAVEHVMNDLQVLTAPVVTFTTSCPCIILWAFDRARAEHAVHTIKVPEVWDSARETYRGGRAHDLHQKVICNIVNTVELRAFLRGNRAFMRRGIAVRRITKNDAARPSDAEAPEPEKKKRKANSRDAAKVTDIETGLFGKLQNEDAIVSLLTSARRQSPEPAAAAVPAPAQ